MGEINSKDSEGAFLESEALRRRIAALEFESQRFKITLQSIGDAVSSTDAQGRVDFMNAMAERHTGWREAEAIGQPLETVFRIVNEETRSNVESPVSRVLRDGALVGLANHTMLVARDGSERLIAGSVAPIRNDAGTVVGAVLVFRDETAEREERRAMMPAVARQEALLAAVPDIVMEVDANKIYSWANQSGQEFFGSDVVGKEAAFYFEGEQDTYNQVRPLFEGDDRTYYVESWQRRRDGERRLLAWWCRVLKDDAGNVTGALSTARDVTEERRAVTEIREAEERFRAFFDNAPIGKSMTAPDGRLLRVNPAFASMLGYSLEEMQDVSFQAITHPDDVAESRECIRALVAGERDKWAMEKRYIAKDGRLVWTSVVTALQRDSQGTPLYLLTHIQDTTAGKQAAEALKRSGARLQRLYESGLLGIISWNVRGQITDANDKFLEMVGYRRDDLEAGRIDWLAMTPPEYRQLDDASILELKATGANRVPIEKEYVRKDGSRLPIIVAGAMLDEERTEGLAIVLDISERKRAEAERHRTQLALQASELRYRTLFETAQGGILILDAESGMILDVNPFLVELTGYSRDEFLTKHLWDIGVFKDIGASKDNFAELLVRQYVRYEDLPLETRDGRRIEVEFVSNLYHVDNQTVVQCNIRDITERARSQGRNQLARQLLELLNCPATPSDQIRGILRLIKKSTGVEAVGIRLKEGDDFPYLETTGFAEHFVQAERYLCARDDEGTILRDTQGSPVLECMCGNVVSRRTNANLPYFTDGGSFWSNCTTALLASTTEEDRQSRTRNRCNREGYESVALVPLRSNNEIVGLLQFNDHRPNRFDAEMIQFFEGMGASIGVALARAQADRDVEEAKQLVESIVDNVPLMIFLKEAHHLRFVALNRAGENLLGHERKELLGKTDLDLFPPEQAASYMAKDREVLAADTLVDIAEEPILTAKKGTRLLHTRKVCIKGADGISKFLLGISDDITERKLEETKREHLEEQLRKSQKMEAIGSLAGGVAHDFNNLLSVILSYTAFATTDGAKENDSLKADLEEVRKAAERAAALTRQLLAFGRRQVLRPVPLNLNQVATGMESMFRRILGEDVSFVQVLASDLGLTLADPSQIEQVLMNLVVNARDAMPEGGRLTIETSNVAIDEAHAAHHADTKPGSYVQLAVTDTGCGMDEQTRARLFEPFFTTKEQGKGTGLGLSTVYGIVNQSGGSIWISSELGKGTTFKIYLPRERSATKAAVIKPPTLPPQLSGTETILVVEDEEALRNVAKRALDAAGYQALSAANGDEALLICAQRGDEIQLVLTDMVMPRMSGRALAQELLKKWPKLKVLYMSGYTDDASVLHDALDAGVHFLAKPFTTTDLTRKVREALDEGTCE